jgi:pyroglutamyl-peptidase
MHLFSSNEAYSKEMRALVTGFEGFGGHVNPSGLIARSLDGVTFGDLVVTGRELPEDFTTLPSVVHDLVKEVKPDILISTGWDYISKFKIEKVALNVQNCEFGDKIVPDNYGHTPSGDEVIPKAPLALKATIPTEMILKELVDAKFPVQLSYSAGTHCCDTVMYSGIYYVRKLKPNSLSGFIHIPPTPEMKVPMDRSAKFTQAKEEEAIQHALIVCRNYLSDKKRMR